MSVRFTPRMTARFWSKVDKAGPIHPVLGTECWLWKPPADNCRFVIRKGYAEGASRFSYWLNFKKHPRRMYVCHRCDNHRCVRPDHLFLGTPADNSADMVAKGRQAEGERHSQARITEAVVKKVFSLRNSGLSQGQIGRRLGLRQQHVSKILNRKLWDHVDVSEV